MLALFKFLADNTDVEFTLKYFKQNEVSMLMLSTYHSYQEAPGIESLGISESSIFTTYHNHPSWGKHDREGDSERHSMGEVYNKIGGDFLNAYKDSKTYPNFVYFPYSGNLYNVSKDVIKFVKKINDDPESLRP